MYLAHLVNGRRLNDCDATSRYSDGVQAAARGLSNSEVCSFAARPAACEDQLFQLARPFSLRDEFTLLAGTGWSFLSRKKNATNSRDGEEDPEHEHVGGGPGQVSLGLRDGGAMFSADTSSSGIHGDRCNPPAPLLLQGTRPSRRGSAHTEATLSGLLDVA